MKQPPGLCWVDKAFMAEECERCYSIWNYSRLANEREGEAIDPRARGTDDTNAPTYLIEQAPQSCCNGFELDTALNRDFFIFYFAEWKAFRQKKPPKNNLTSAKVAYWSPSCFSQRGGVKVLLFGRIYILLLELPDPKPVVSLFIVLFTGKLLLKRQKPSKVQYSAHACDVRKKHRSLGLSRGLAQETEDYILHHSCCFATVWSNMFATFITATVEKPLQINRHKYKTRHPVMDLRHRLQC